ncbi:MAG: SpoIID/LytB domain-containing protein [Lachnospiraceae bacterium]
MWLKLKKMGCCLLIIVLLPYVVTVFINGPSITAQSRVDQTYIQVKMSGEKAEEGQVIEMPLEDYGIGVMAKEIPADYEKEALKAQAAKVDRHLPADSNRREQGGGPGKFLEPGGDAGSLGREGWNLLPEIPGCLAGDGRTDSDLAGTAGLCAVFPAEYRMYQGWERGIGK